MLAVSGGTVIPRALHAQGPISSTVSCPDCTLRITRVALLGRDSASLITPVSTVCRSPTERYYVSPLIDPSRIAVYGASGTQLAEIGRKGNGPGEFEHIVAVLCGRQGHLHVFDRGNTRLTLLNKSGEAVAESLLQLSRWEGAVLLPDGRIAVNAASHEDERIGNPIHVLRADGRVDRSMGASDDDAFVPDPVADRRILSSAGADRLWAARMNRYDIELWSTEGRLTKTIRRAASWFEPWDRLDPGEPFSARPKPRVLSMRQDANGYLWTSVLVPSTDWAPGNPHGQSQGLGFPGMAAYDSKWDAIIEVIDVANSRLVYAARTKGIAFRFMGDDLAFRPREADDGTHYLEVVRLRLTRP